jgi:hypothetical protein
MQKAFACLRVSDKGQVEGDGFTRQLGRSSGTQRRTAIKIVCVYHDEGVSGTKDLETGRRLSR